MPRITVLGSGTSTGVPEVGCRCKVCTSSDARDKRLRNSLLYETNCGRRILFDCGPDFRQQALRERIDHLDAIIITHEHIDHVGGLDDLRTIAWHQDLPIYAEERVLREIRDRLYYFFQNEPYPGSPRLILNEVKEGKPFEVEGVEILPIRVTHGSLPILGYRVGDLAYITDLKTIDGDSRQALEGVKTLFINGLRVDKPHPSHQTIEEAIELIERIGEPQSYLIHLSHQAPLMTQMNHFLPSHIDAAYDQMKLDLPMPPYRYADCGEIAYEKALELQYQHFNANVAAKTQGRPTHNVLLFCEHEPVLTLGLHGKRSNVIASQDLLNARGIRLHPVDRGGDITYHGPGQITGYPIFDIETYGIGLKQFIAEIESCIIELLSDYGINAEQFAGATGVWIDTNHPQKARKICAIGLRASRYCTMHGFALNVNTDVSYFGLIHPCGFADRGVTSMANELGAKQDFLEVKRHLERILHRHFLHLYMVKSTT